MRTLLPLGILVSLAGFACGPTPEPVAPKRQLSELKPVPAAVATASPLDLSPAPEPANLVGLVGWSNPSAALSTLTGCAGLPPQLVEANVRIAIEEMLDEALGQSVDKKQLGAVVALDAPVHFVVALDANARRSSPIAALSVGLSSLERAKGAVEATMQLTELMPGMWKLGGKERSSSSCAIAASAGSTPARLICGDRDKDVTALGPYLARTLPVTPPDVHDLHGEIRFVPLSDRFGGLARQQLRGLPILAQSELSIGEPKFDKALLTAASGIQDELTALIGDADKLTFDVSVDARTCLTARGALELRGKTSWLANAISDNTDGTGAPPTLFWRLPKESDAAFFSRSPDPGRFSAVLTTLRALLEGWLTKENIGTPADRKALADLIQMPLRKGTISVSASGHVDALPVKGGNSTPQQLLDGMLGSWIGWTLVGADEGPDVLTKYLKDLAAAYNRPSLMRSLKKELRDDAKLLPTVRIVPAPKELGKSSLDMEIKFKDIPAPDDGLAPPAPGKAAPKPKTLNFAVHVLLLGEEKATWIAFGTNRAELVKHLSSVKSDAPTAGTLASRSGLDPLKTGTMTSGGFLTMAPLTRAFTGGLNYFSQTMGNGGSVPSEMQEIMSILNNLPHKAESPMFLMNQARGGDAPRGEISFNLTQPALEDLGALLLGGLKVAGMLNP